MQSSTARRRARAHLARRNVDIYPLALGSVAVFCLVTTLAVLFLQPRWDAPVMDIPLGAYLFGGAGGVLTIVLCPGRSRRLGSRNPSRAVVFTFYGLACAILLGGLGYVVLTYLEHVAGLVVPDWFRYAFALVSGLLEGFVNEVVLRALGFLAPREIDPRLL